MKNNILKKLLIVSIIFMILATDFYVLGAGIKSYAATADNETNNKNIEFSAYFKNENNEHVDKISQSIKNTSIKLYAGIKVKNDGYFNGSIQISDSNFKVKNNILSKYVEKIEENKISLNQINAGESVEIELEVEPIILDTLSPEMLSAESSLTLSGTYMETTYKGLDINATRKVSLNLVIDENAKSSLSTEIITNKVLALNGENKRIIQLLIKSGLEDNQYPIKNTAISINIPQFSGKNPTDINVFALETKATNGKDDSIITDWKNENNVLTINLENALDENKQIKWSKTGEDQLVVTFVYDEDVDAKKVEIETNSEISIYNTENKYTAKYKTGIENTELNGIASAEIKSNNTEIYKGQLYANTRNTEKIEIPYSTTTTVENKSVGIVDQISVLEDKDIYVTESSTLATDSKIKSTEINKDKMIELLGEDGTIIVKNEENEIIINNDSQADENGNIIINHGNGTNSVNIILSKPIKAGKIEIKNNKVIVGDKYTSNQLKTINGIKTKDTIIATSGNTKVMENTTEITTELKETMTKAELIVDKDTLSTITTNNDITLGVKLLTANTKYDLYKNPTITIKLPDSIENMKINSFDKLYGENFEITKAVYNKANKTIEIALSGEQLEYTEEATQLYLQLNVTITLNKQQPSKTDEITMTYTNEKAIQYEGEESFGIATKEINISSPSGLVLMNNATSYDITGIKGITDDSQTINIQKTDAGKTINFQIGLINNVGEDISNVNILGKLPTDIKTEKTELTTTLKAISGSGEIYYSENANATADLTKIENGWTSNLNNLTNPRIYLIKIGTLENGTNYFANYTIQLPNEIESNLSTYENFIATYNTSARSINKETSTSLELNTPKEIIMNSTLSAKVGNDTINNGDTVKAGEVVNYTLSITNNGVQDLSNVTAKVTIPSGTVLFEDDQENSSATQISKTIDTLKSGETKNIAYSLKVKEDVENNVQVSSKASVSCENKTIESNEVNFKTEQIKVKVSIKQNITGGEVIFVKGTTVDYIINIENRTNSDIKNLKVKIQNDSQIKTKYIMTEGVYITDIPETYVIENLPANSSTYLIIGEQILADSGNYELSVSVNNSNNETYRSNTISQNLKTVDVKLAMSSSYENKNVEEGQTIPYEIILENTGSALATATFKMDIPNGLTVQELYVNGVLKYQTTDKSQKETYVEKINVNEMVSLDIGKKKTILVNAIADELAESEATKTVITTSQVLINGEEKDSKTITTNIIKSINGGNDDNNNGEIITGNIINGIVWLDQNVNGERETTETIISNIKVRLYDVNANEYAKTKSGKIIEATTSENGIYTLSGIEDGQYIVLFEYDTEKYEPTTYNKENVDSALISKVIAKELTIDGTTKTYGVTDTITVNGNISNINMGLKDIKIFDLQLNKYISRIAVQTKKGTKSYDYNDATYAKVEINSKQLKNALVVLEYTIRVKNAGEVAGYVKNIVDYIPEGLTFSSELNSDWYLADGQLYNKSLANEKINPGESREVKVILTKTMTEDNTGLVNNRAELYETYNEYGLKDINSTENNQVKGENDYGIADVTISIATGGRTMLYTILILINTLLISVAIYLVIKNSKRSIKWGRR